MKHSKTQVINTIDQHRLAIKVPPNPDHQIRKWKSKLLRVWDKVVVTERASARSSWTSSNPEKAQQIMLYRNSEIRVGKECSLINKVIGLCRKWCRWIRWLKCRTVRKKREKWGVPVLDHLRIYKWKRANILLMKMIFQMKNNQISKWWMLWQTSDRNMPVKKHRWQLVLAQLAHVQPHNHLQI